MNSFLVKKGRIVFKAETAKTFFQKFKGLMFSEKKNLLFIFDKERIVPIHSFFVFFQFDAVYLNSKKRIIEIKKNIAPFTFFVQNKIPAKYLFEITEKNNLKIGDKLSW